MAPGGSADYDASHRPACCTAAGGTYTGPTIRRPLIYRREVTEDRPRAPNVPPHPAVRLSPSPPSTLCVACCRAPVVGAGRARLARRGPARRPGDAFRPRRRRRGTVADPRRRPAGRRRPRRGQPRRQRHRDPQRRPHQGRRRSRSTRRRSSRTISASTPCAASAASRPATRRRPPASRSSSTSTSSRRSTASASAATRQFDTDVLRRLIERDTGRNYRPDYAQLRPEQHRAALPRPQLRPRPGHAPARRADRRRHLRHRGGPQGLRPQRRLRRRQKLRRISPEKAGRHEGLLAALLLRPRRAVRRAPARRGRGEPATLLPRQRLLRRPRRPPRRLVQGPVGGANRVPHRGGAALRRGQGDVQRQRAIDGRAVGGGRGGSSRACSTTSSRSAPPSRT